MTRLVQAELLKLWTTRTARVLLALATAGTAALVTLVLVFAGRPGQPTLGDDALGQLVLAPTGRSPWPRFSLASSAWPASSATAPPPRPSWSPRCGAGRRRPGWPPPPSPAWPWPWWPRPWCWPSPCPGRQARGVEVDLADPGLAARVGGPLGAAVALYAVLGTGLGALFRNQFAAVVVGVLWWQGGVEDLLVGVLRRPGLGRWLPDGAAAALTAPGDGTLAMWAGGLVLAAYGLALAMAGGRLVVRRDLS